MNGREWIVIKPWLNGNMEQGYRTDYETDLVRNPTRQAAIKHGWREWGHDDWLLGALEGNTLVLLAWMDEDRDSADELADVAAQLYFESPAVSS